DAPVPLMLTSPTGRVLRANRVASQLFGLGTDELEGMNPLERVHPEDLAAVAPTWQHMLTTSGPAATADDVRLLTPTGYRWHRVEATAARRPTGEFQYATVHLVDIDEARRTATQLGRSERRFGSLVETLPDAVMRFDRSERVTFANAAAVRVSQRMAAAGVVMRDGWPLLEPVAANTLSESIRLVFAKGETITVEYGIGSGEVEIWNESTLVPEFAVDGSVESVLMVGRDITDRRRHESDLAHRATHDALTGLPNRSLLLATVAQASDALDVDGSRLALLFLDVDRFKTINDTLGHGIGDQVLCNVAERFAAVLRPSDLLARLGGDEFTVLLTDIGTDEALQIAQRLQESLRDPVVIDGTIFRLTASIGVVEIDEPTRPADLLRWADAAMYEAKALGRDRVCRFDERLRAEAIERNELDRDLSAALDRSEFELFFQPEVDLCTGEVLGCEALLRWRHPTRGLMTADRFVPLAEENGTIVALGRWVLATACRAVLRWQRAGIVDESFVLRVNLSPRQIEQPGLASDVAQLLDELGLAPSQLCLEVTETALMRDVQAGMRALLELHEVGVTLAIDDFGTGYSSLGYLKRFPLDVLKIDRTFVDGLPEDTDDMAITTAILDLARSLGLAVTAEGVETEQQRRALIDLGCRRAQGYLFGRPMPAEELIEAIASSTDRATTWN
ncbi:MAG: EAL domain-containing protein, partial [Actinobacteria bacterium]|nr:EAL domain-containing protein [Actinomycetota bacterium]